jgi:hypothetical protein
MPSGVGRIGKRIDFVSNHTTIAIEGRVTYILTRLAGSDHT